MQIMKDKICKQCHGTMLIKSIVTKARQTVIQVSKQVKWECQSCGRCEYKLLIEGEKE